MLVVCNPCMHDAPDLLLRAALVFKSAVVNFGIIWHLRGPYDALRCHLWVLVLSSGDSIPTSDLRSFQHFCGGLFLSKGILSNEGAHQLCPCASLRKACRSPPAFRAARPEIARLN